MRYWPSVSRSQPASRRAASVSNSSSRVSPRPSIRPLLVLIAGLRCFDAPQERQRPAEIALGPRTCAVEPRHRFGVVVENFRRGFDHAIDGRQIADEVGREHFDRRAGPLAHGQDAAIKMLGAAIGQVVARDRSDDDMLQAQPRSGFGQPLGLIALGRRGTAALDGTKAAGPRADVAQDHERGRLLRIALHPVGTFGVFADRFQPQLVEQPGREMVGVALGHIPLQPARQAQGIVRAWPAS